MEIIATSNGIVCKTSNKTVHLDPKKTSKEGINFVSHAHFDHLPYGDDGIFLSSRETKRLALLRAHRMTNHHEVMQDFTMINNGHILGSTGLLFDGVYYTGDICTRRRASMYAARIPKCDTLIIESTFGLPRFVFPPIKDVVDKVNQIISKAYANGSPVLLLGYKLGKAQVLNELFKNWEPFFFYNSVKQVNDVYIELGVNLKPGENHIVAEKKGLLNKPPWIMICPKDNGTTDFIKIMKSRYKAIIVEFTGWVVNRKYGIADYHIPLSDHCDYNELIGTVMASGASKVYTTHGYTKEFANILSNMGIESKALTEK